MATNRDSVHLQTFARHPRKSNLLDLNPSSDLPDVAGDVTLTPNRKLSFNKQTNKVRVSEVDAKDALSWMDGSLKFSEQPFMSIAKDLERKFNVRIRIESDPLRKEIFSGSFTKDYSLDKILREVDVDHKYVWTRSGDEIIIKDK